MEKMDFLKVTFEFGIAKHLLLDAHSELEIASSLVIEHFPTKMATKFST
jgi:hypothetical protein